MDINSLKSNSNKSKKKRELPKQTVKGDVRVKKKTTGRRIIESAMAEDLGSIKKHVIEEVIDPSIREIIFNVIKDGLELGLFGKQGRKRGSGSSGHSSYGSYYKSGGQSSSRPVGNRPARRTAYELEEIEFDYKEDAENVLDELCEEIASYGNVTGEVLCSLLGRDANYTDRKYGWTDLSTARIDRIRGGSYILSLPKAEVIE